MMYCTHSRRLIWLWRVCEREREMGIAYHFGALDTTRCTNAWARTRCPLKTHVYVYTRSLCCNLCCYERRGRKKNTRQGRLSSWPTHREMDFCQTVAYVHQLEPRACFFVFNFQRKCSWLWVEREFWSYKLHSRLDHLKNTNAAEIIATGLKTCARLLVR
jgi:hypothetical protein